MKVAIVGSRKITDGLHHIFDALCQPTWREIVSGGAVGTDTLAASWASERGLPLTVHLPDYNLHGRHAPHVRNRVIVDSCDLLIACWDVEVWPDNAMSMLARARKRHIPVVRVANGVVTSQTVWKALDVECQR